MKLKLKGAQTGHSLLKRKSEALTKRFRGITVKIDEVKTNYQSNFSIKNLETQTCA
jgi:vacuolar-type H+-ATPase subunit D/Vma8